MEWLDEDATRAEWILAEETAECEPEPDPMAEDRLLDEFSRVMTVNPPALPATGGTGRERGRCDDSEGERVVVEIRPDEAAADGRAKELGEKQARLSSYEDGVERGMGNNLSTLLDHQKCGRSPLTRSFPIFDKYS
jgi:hypothetical protein